MPYIDKTQLQELQNKASKWDAYCEKQKQRSNSRSPEKRRADAQKAIKTKWEKYYANKKGTTC